jgi:hypothetical protein
MDRPPRPNLIYTAPELAIALLQVGKAASTAIKTAMWRAVARARGEPELAEDWPKLNKLPRAELRAAIAKETFMVVRDPLERFWSAYHNKILGRDPGVLARLTRRYGAVEALGPDEFARLIADDPDEVADRHFCPQTVLRRGVRIDRWFRYERLDEVDAYLRERIGEPLGVANVNRSKPAMTFAPETEARLRRYYAEDYELLAEIDAGQRHSGANRA